jgi:pyruvate dehydrogenase E1 component beta subunit
MVLMTSVGGGYGDAGQHSQTLFAAFGHMPGLKVVIPSTAYDAKGMMIAAIRDPNPVIFMFHKALQGMGWLGTVQRSVTDVPEDVYEVPLSKANVVREGRDVTVVGLGATVHMALDAAEELERDGIHVEVIDLRAVAPLDRATIVASAAKTGALLSVDDDYLSYGIGAEVIASVSESVKLRKIPRRISYPDIPVPFAPSMEHAVLPNKDKIVAAIKDMLEK